MQINVEVAFMFDFLVNIKAVEFNNKILIAILHRLTWESIQSFPKYVEYWISFPFFFSLYISTSAIHLRQKST